MSEADQLSNDQNALYRWYKDLSYREQAILFSNTDNNKLKQLLAKSLAQPHKNLQDLVKPETLPLADGTLIIETERRRRAFILNNHGCLLYTSPSPRDS